MRQRTLKRTVLFILFCLHTIPVFSIVPSYHGARSLSLGYASTAFNYDVNSIFINPSILSSLNFSLWGYQYQNSHMDYMNFAEDLEDALGYDLGHFESLEGDRKGEVFSTLKDLFMSKSGMYGSRSNVPGFVGRSYGFSMSAVNTAFINPRRPVAGFFDRNPEDISNADIKALMMEVTGLKYKRMSFSYSLQMSRSISMGVSLHYLNGKVTRFNESLTGEMFSAPLRTREYLEYAWEKADHKFKRIVTDVGITMAMGRFFSLGLVYKNVGSAKIKTPDQEILLSKRVIAGLAFRPDTRWGVYMDMDIKKNDLLVTPESQPISIGIERGFFKNTFFVRAGMLNDLTEKHFFGKKSNALYGLGIGFNLRKFVVDLAVGIGGGGAIKSLAISGFIITR